MADKPYMRNSEARAIAEETVRGFDNIQGVMHESVQAIQMMVETMKTNTEGMNTFIGKRLALAALERNAAIAAENTARQSAYLARISCMAEQDQGVAISPLDLLLGIVNGIEQSGVDLSVCGSREDVALIVETAVKQGENAIRSNMNQGGGDA